VSTISSCRSSRVWGSERSYEMLTESLQTLGGSGYLQDYPIEQYIRDVKIDTLFEGTTAIQALDFLSARSSATARCSVHLRHRSHPRLR